MALTTRHLALGVVALAFTPCAAETRQLLHRADVRVEFSAPTTCVVDLALGVDVAAGTEVEHRVEAAEGTRVTLTAVEGAVAAGEVESIGSTRALVLRPASGAYSLRYIVEQPATRAGRCPLWIPRLSTDGRTQAVRLRVQIPAGATAVGTMPAFAWVGQEGTATLGHLPAFVRVPLAMPGASTPRDIASVMDLVAIVTLIVASLAWTRASARRRASAATGAKA